MNKINVKTDIALETAELLLSSQPENELDGVEMSVEEFEYGVKLTTVRIVNANGAESMGKPEGNYITIEAAGLRDGSIKAHEQATSLLADRLAQLTKLDQDSSVLIVGLGNWNVTPDALGPKAVDKLLVTRHMIDSLPPELVNSARSVSAISPGVMGITGIETCEIVKGVVEKTQPDVVIAIDALAARSSKRINSTIQLSDAGINPGAGLGNMRMRLSESTLGVPVIGIGVPTVNIMQL